MKFAVIAETFSADAREASAAARRYGFSGILFNAYSPTLSLPDLSQTGRREFRHTLAAQQIELVGLQGDIGPKGFGAGADLDRLLDRIDRAMEAAAGLNAPLLCLEIGPLAEPPQSVKPKPAITSEQAGLLILPTSSAEPAPVIPPAPADTALQNAVNTVLAEVAIRADRYNVVVALRSALSSFAALEAAIRAVRCSWFGIDLDPVAMLTDESNADEIFSQIGSLIRHVRARDALRGSDRRIKPAVIGQGHVDWAMLLARLDQSGYGGWMTIDPIEAPDRAGAAATALRHLRTTPQ